MSTSSWPAPGRPASRAARRLLAAGLSVAVLEARDRVGGRAVTVALKGHPVDLGAHWLHAGPINPLVSLGRSRGEPLRRAPQDSHLVIGRRMARPEERAAFSRAFDRADRALAQAARSGSRPSGGRRTAPPRAVARAHRHGARAPRRAPARRGQPARRPEHGIRRQPLHRRRVRSLSGAARRRPAGPPRRAPCASSIGPGPASRSASDAGRVSARAALITVPVAVLASGAVRFSPPLPTPIAEAMHGFLPGTYEHVVLHWPGSPFRGADRLASIVGGRFKPPGLLARIDGTPFHYFELDHPDGRRGSTAAGRTRRAASPAPSSPSISADAPSPASRSRRSPTGAAIPCRAPPGRACRPAATPSATTSRPRSAGASGSPARPCRARNRARSAALGRTASARPRPSSSASAPAGRRLNKAWPSRVIPGRCAESAEGKGIQEPSALLDPLPVPSGSPGMTAQSMLGSTRSGGLWPSMKVRMLTITFSPMSMRPS